jgi:hypothetical protein
MYHGEVNIAQEDLSSFLRVAEELAVKGLTDGNKNGSGDGESASSPPAAKPAKKLVKKSGGLKRPPMLQPSPNAAAKQAAAAAAAAAVSSSSSSPSALPLSSSSTALNNSSNNSPSLSKKPKMSTFDDRPHVVKPDLENSLASHEDGSEEMEDYGFGPGEGFGPEGEYLDDSMAADDMEAAGGIGMPPAGMDADGNKGKRERINEKLGDRAPKLLLSFWAVVFLRRTQRCLCVLCRVCGASSIPLTPLTNS